MGIKKPLFTAIILAYYSGFVFLTDNFIIVRVKSMVRLKDSSQQHDITRLVAIFYSFFWNYQWFILGRYFSGFWQFSLDIKFVTGTVDDI